LTHQLYFSKGEIALLQQHDDFFSMLTPNETVDLASYLQLAQYSKTKRQALSQEIIEALGLSHVQKRRIGGGRWSFSGASLSGGERRRLSVGKIYNLFSDFSSLHP
jgi:ABC-type multidrug transport system ATPase subunit